MITQRLWKIPWQSLPAWIAGNRLRILMLHSISENPNDPHATHPTEFQLQMQKLKFCKVVSLTDGLNLLKKKQNLKNTYVITFDDSLLDFYTIALPILIEYGYPATMFVPTGLVGGHAVWDSYDKTKQIMNWHQLEDCQKWNISFGSHTSNHVRLTECSQTILLKELEDSLKTLQSRLEHVIPALAYPGGYYDARVQLAVRNTGYICALGASSRWQNGSESDLFQLRRETINR